jgi:tight adherence protein C
VTVLLILGLVLLAWSVAFVIRALAVPHGTGETIEQIGQYGFTATDVPDEDADRQERGLDRLATNFGELLGKRLSWFDEEELRIRLISAGMYSTTPSRLLGYQGILALVLLLLWIWIGGVQNYSPLTIAVGGAVALALGWLLPAFYVTMQIRKRREAIDYELPEMIDLFVVAIEAGVSLAAAIRIAAREIPGPLGQELRLTLQEQNLGLSTEEALENLGVRADSPNMRMFVRSIVQGETLGISIGQIMRNLSDEMRKRRKAKAEERARKAPVKMVFPLVLLIFPAMFVVLVLPAIITIADVLGG